MYQVRTPLLAEVKGLVGGYIILRDRFAERRSMLAALFVAVVGVVVVLDLVGVDGRYMFDGKWAESKPMEQSPTAADRDILQDEELGYRVLDLSGDPFNSARASYFHRSVGGYHGAKLGRYQEVIDAHLSKFNPEVYALYMAVRLAVLRASWVLRPMVLRGLCRGWRRWLHPVRSLRL